METKRPRIRITGLSNRNELTIDVRAHPPAAVRTRAVSFGAYLAIALGLALSLGLVGASALLAGRNAQALELVARTQEARAALSRALSALESAETGQRGYLLTGDDAYLDPYRQGSTQAPAALSALEQSLHGLPETGAATGQVRQLKELSKGKLDELQRTIALAQQGRRPEAMEIVRSGLGKRIMDQFREVAAGLEEEQQRLLDQQIASMNGGGRLLVVADAVGFVLLAVLAGAIGWGAWNALRTLRRAQGALSQAYQALEAANASLEQRVAERTRDLTEANEEIQRFAYIVSHDLRAPLVNIMGFTTELETAVRTISAFVSAHADGDAAGSEAAVATQEDIPEALQFIKTSTAKMDRLISAILTLSREGRRVLRPEPVQMQPLLQAIVASMQHQITERGAEVSVGDVPDMVADRLVLEQVFSNLIENALKYASPARPGRIRVSGRTVGAAAVIEVADNGRGIAARDLERVFELFRRAGDQSVPGEGIGLAHTRALVRRMGGQIGCVSTEGVGSTFRVTLPKLAQATQSREAAET